MIIFPAIDIKEGKVVRLRQGEFSKVTEYSSDPVSIAQQWVDQGAEWLHVVDLDGAQTGEIKNFSVIAKIAKSVKASIQVGGGIRHGEEIERFFDSGIQRVILGTKIIEDRTFLKDILAQWSQRIAVSLDCQNGMVAQRGWTTVTDLKGTDLAKELEGLGLKVLIFTDIKRDGMLQGPNFAALEEMLATVKKTAVIASGGVANLDDIERLLPLKAKGLLGVITGKAIYEGTLDLKSAIKLSREI